MVTCRKAGATKLIIDAPLPTATPSPDRSNAWEIDLQSVRADTPYSSTVRERLEPARERDLLPIAALCRPQSFETRLVGYSYTSDQVFETAVTTGHLKVSESFFSRENHCA
jgi:hypothetical protein